MEDTPYENKSKQVLEDQEFCVSDEGTIYVKEGGDVYRLEYDQGFHLYRGILDESFEGQFSKAKPSALVNLTDVGVAGHVCFLHPTKAVQTNDHLKRKATVQAGLVNAKKAKQQTASKNAKKVMSRVDETVVIDDDTSTTDGSDDDYSAGGEKGHDDEEEEGEGEEEEYNPPPEKKTSEGTGHPKPIQRSKTVSVVVEDEICEIKTPETLTRCDDSNYADIHPIELSPPPAKTVVPDDV